ncbi:hypothetical protein WJX81_000199 [Elliptochloris bilobata]|uniref:Uncharacterized protein n=1 Tax=Elliptochloris bilobata TaxID=381761 RepID=A0AAW1QJM3_9CHLO
MASPAPDAVSSQERSTLAAKCPEHVLQAIYGKTAEKRKVYEQSLNSWWAEYAARKNDEEDEHVADSLLYDLNHLPRAAPPPECVHAARAALAASGVAPQTLQLVQSSLAAPGENGS